MVSAMQLQDETRNIQILSFSATYIRCLRVNISNIT